MAKPLTPQEIDALGTSLPPLARAYTPAEIDALPEREGPAPDPQIPQTPNERGRVSSFFRSLGQSANEATLDIVQAPLTMKAEVREQQAREFSEPSTARGKYRKYVSSMRTQGTGQMERAQQQLTRDAQSARVDSNTFEELKGAVPATFDANPKYRGEFITSKVPSALGSSVPAVVGGMASGGTMVVPVFLQGLQIYQSTYDDAIQAGLPPETAHRAGKASMPGALVEALPLGKVVPLEKYLFRSLDDAFKASMRPKEWSKFATDRALKLVPQAIREGTEEGIQETYQQQVNEYFDIEKLTPGQRVARIGEAMLLGTIAAPAFSAPVTAVDTVEQARFMRQRQQAFSSLTEFRKSPEWKEYVAGKRQQPLTPEEIDGLETEQQQARIPIQSEGTAEEREKIESPGTGDSPPSAAGELPSLQQQAEQFSKGVVPQTPAPNLTSEEIKQQKEDLIRRRVREGVPPETIQIVVQKDPAVPGFGYVQVDELDPKKSGLDKNVWSSNPEALREYGLDIPSQSELMKLPAGVYTLPQAQQLLNAPTAEQKASGNFPKPKMKFQGLDIAIETMAGSERSGKDKTGKPWSVEMPVDYGFIQRTEGKDGDAVDVYVGWNSAAPKVFVIDQVDPDTHAFDEHKTFVGFNSLEDALAAYSKAFSDNSSSARIGNVREMSMDEFKAWLKTGDTTKPAAGPTPSIEQQPPQPSPTQPPIVLTFKDFLTAPREGPLLDALRSLPRTAPSAEQVSANERYEAASAAIDGAKMTWIYDRVDASKRRMVEGAIRKLSKAKRKLVSEYEAALSAKAKVPVGENVQRALYDQAVAAGLIQNPEVVSDAPPQEQIAVREKAVTADEQGEELKTRLTQLVGIYETLMREAARTRSRAYLLSIGHPEEQARAGEEAAKLSELENQILQVDQIVTQMQQQLQAVTAVRDEAQSEAEQQGRPILSAHGISEITSMLSDPQNGLSTEARDVAVAFLNTRVMQSLDWSRLRLQMQDEMEGNIAGRATIAKWLIALSRQSRADTFPHEVFHFLYEMLPRKDQEMVQQARFEAITAAARTLGRKPSAYIVNFLASLTERPMSSAQFRALREQVREHDPEAAEWMTAHYSLITPSEFLATMAGEKFATDILSARTRTWVGRFIDTLRQWLAAITDALRKLAGARPTMEQVYRDMIAGRVLNTPETGEASEQAVQESLGRETQTQGAKFRVKSSTPSPVDREAGMRSAQARFAAAGLRVTVGDDGRWQLDDGDGWPRREAEGVKLLELLVAAASEVNRLSADGATPNDRNISFIDSVRHIAVRQRELLDAGEETAFAPETVNELLAVSQGIASEAGRLLQLFDSGQRDFVTKLRKVDVELRTVMGETFNGALVRKVLLRALSSFREFFTDAEVSALSEGNAEIEQLLAELERRTYRETGGYVYRMAQARLKPQVLKTLKWLESDAQRREAVEQIIQNFVQMGGKLPERTGQKLSPREQMILMATPESVAKLDAAIAQAVRQAERNAAREVIVAENALAEDELALYDARTTDPSATGPDPSAEHVERGLELPKFSRWKVIRDNLLGYSPLTDRLIIRVVQGDFAGTRFEKLNVAPADTRIDLKALATAPEDEVQRVMDAHAINLQSELAAASPFMRQRIMSMIQEQVSTQLNARRQEVLDRFFNPTLAVQQITATASERFQKLVNAGISKDRRFNTDKTRSLIKRIAGTYMDADEVNSLATMTREEKTEWITRKLNEVIDGEKLDAMPQAAGDYFKAVAFTHLAERLQSAEERVARRFLDGRETGYEQKVTTPEDRAKSIERAKVNLMGVINAGGLDTAIVESAGRKSQVKRLMPTMSDMVKQVLATPFYRHTELADRFAEGLATQFSMDAALADKAKAVFRTAFGDKLSAASVRAAQSALQSLTPKERNDIPEGRQLHDKLIEMVNARGFDPDDTLRAVAAAQGWRITDSDIQKIKDLAEREQRLESDLPQKTLDDIGLTPEQVLVFDTSGEGLTVDQATALQDARVKQLGFTDSERKQLRKQMVAIWLRMTKPPGTGTHETRKNAVRMVNELSPVNLLTRWTFPFVQSIDIATQLFAHTATTAFAHAQTRYSALPTDERGVGPWLTEYVTALKDSWNITRRVAGSGIAALRAALPSGRGLPPRIGGLETSVATFDRMALKADELLASDDIGKRIQGALLWMSNFAQFGSRVSGALDLFQSSPTRFKELAQDVRTILRVDNGLSAAEAEVIADNVIGDINAEITLAAAEAPLVLAALGIQESEQGLKVAAWNAVWRRMLARATAAGLDTTAIEADIERRVQTLGWNRPENSWIGRIIATPARAIQEAAADIYFPTGGLTAFANAMAYSIAQKLQYTPVGFAPLAFKGSPSAQTPLDRTQIKIKAALGMMVGAPFVLLAASGAIKAILDWPDDEEERRKMQALGLRPGVVLIPIGDGRTITVSLTAGPLNLVSPYIALGASVRALLDKQAKKQVEINKEALRLGIAPGVAPGPTVLDYLNIPGAMAMEVLRGSRTVSGKALSYSDRGEVFTNKAIAGWASSILPFVPLYQNTMRILGVEIDPRKAESFVPILFPTPGSPAERVNALGDRASDLRDVTDIISLFTRGTGKIVDDAQLSSDVAYANLFATGYNPPAISPGKGYNFNGIYRPMEGSELEKYGELRGRYFKQQLADIGPTDDRQAVRAAYQRANARALQEVGADVPEARQTPAQRAGRPGIRTVRSSVRRPRGFGLAPRRRLSSSRRPRRSRYSKSPTPLRAGRGLRLRSSLRPRRRRRS